MRAIHGINERSLASRRETGKRQAQKKRAKFKFNGAGSSTSTSSTNSKKSKKRRRVHSSLPTRPTRPLVSRRTGTGGGHFQTQNPAARTKSPHPHAPQRKRASDTHESRGKKVRKRKHAATKDGRAHLGTSLGRAFFVAQSQFSKTLAQNGGYGGSTSGEGCIVRLQCQIRKSIYRGILVLWSKGQLPEEDRHSTTASPCRVELGLCRNRWRPASFMAKGNCLEKIVDPKKL